MNLDMVVTMGSRRALRNRREPFRCWLALMILSRS